MASPTTTGIRASAPGTLASSRSIGPRSYQGYLYTDRPIYRPGQTVYFKGILRADDDAHYSLPTDVKSVKVLVNDPQGKELFKKDLSFNDMGTFFDELTLDAEAPLGYYYIWFENQALEINTGTSFQVAEYRVPEYQVTVTTDRDGLHVGRHHRRQRRSDLLLWRAGGQRRRPLVGAVRQLFVQLPVPGGPAVPLVRLDRL